MADVFPSCSCSGKGENHLRLSCGEKVQCDDWTQYSKAVREGVSQEYRSDHACSKCAEERHEQERAAKVRQFFSGNVQQSDTVVFSDAQLTHLQAWANEQPDKCAYYPGISEFSQLKHLADGGDIETAAKDSAKEASEDGEGL